MNDLLKEIFNNIFEFIIKYYLAINKYTKINTYIIYIHIVLSLDELSINNCL